MEEELLETVSSSAGCVRLFVGGDRTQVGKTTVCLGILGYLRREMGVAAADLAYIKPATQCEAADLLSAYCAAEGILHVGGSEAPIVYYPGFTRAVINGTAAVDAEATRRKIDEVCRGKKFCVIDGVGFPGVGSCVGASNADVALWARAPVVLVSKSGVGAAIDAHCGNASFFAAKGVPVLGAIFNMAPLEGFYKKDEIEPVVHRFFHASRPRETLYGVVPLLAPSETLADANIDHLKKHIDLKALIQDCCLDVFNRKRRPTTHNSEKEPLDQSKVPDRQAIEQQATKKGAIVSAR